MTDSSNPLSIRRILKIWWPLAASWLLMAVEMPALSAVVARLPNAEINLAAYGGIVFPIALIIEAPVIMLLAGSTALSKDHASYLKIRRFMMWTGFGLTLAHILLAFTPLYYFVAERIIGAPDVIVEPARLGLMILTPWTWSIAYRRFQQGIMIRFGRSREVGAGTVVRLLTGGLVLLLGYWIGSIPGVAVGASAQALGVLSEAAFAGWRVRSTVRNRLVPAAPVEPLTWKAFFDFYTPLALTSLLFLIWLPIGSAALSRMPRAVASLAVWQVLSGLTFMMRSFGFAYNEVVVALMDERLAYRALRRFTVTLTGATSLVHLMIVATPLVELWFGGVAALPSELAEMARTAFWIALPLAGLSVLQSWFQGSLTFSRKTRPIPEAVMVFLFSVVLVLGIGVYWGQVAGLYIGMLSFAVANGVQTIWLWQRSADVMRNLCARDSAQECQPVRSDL